MNSKFKSYNSKFLLAGLVSLAPMLPMPKLLLRTKPIPLLPTRRWSMWLIAR